MFLFNRSKNSTNDKKGLPDKLLSLKGSHDTAWVWDPEYKMLIWANVKGMEFWQVETRYELKELIFPETHDMVQKSNQMMRGTKSGKKFVQDLILKVHPQEQSFSCEFERQELPDGRQGILVILKNVNILEDNEEVIPEIGNMETNTDLELQELEKELPDTTNEETKEALEELKEELGEEEVSDNLFSNPILLTIGDDGNIIEIPIRTKDILNVDVQNNIIEIFTKQEEGEIILNELKAGNNISHCAMLGIEEKTLPCLLQSEIIENDDKKVFNVAIIRITYDQYFLDQKTQINEEDNIDSEFLPSQDNIEDENELVLTPEQEDLINNSSIGVFVTDKEGIIIKLNQKASSILGNDEYKDVSILDIFDDETSQTIKNALLLPNMHLEDFTKGIDCDYKNKDNDNNKCHLVIREHSEKKDNFWFLISDLSDVENDNINIDKTEEEIKESVEEETEKETEKPIDNNVTSIENEEYVEEFTSSLDIVSKNEETDIIQDKSIPDFISDISHQLRSPLNAISGYAQLIDNEAYGKLDPKYKQYLNSIHISCSHATELIDNILNYSAIENGVFEPKNTAVNLKDIIDFVVTIMHPNAKFHKVEIASKVLNDTPYIKVDSHLLKQILNNLVSNAIKYSDKKTVIYVVAGVTKTNRVMIEVTNFGKGMDKDQLSQALKPYKRVGRQDYINGTGLGLPIAKKMTEITGGHFFIDSVPGDRTRARVIYEKDRICHDLEGQEV